MKAFQVSQPIILSIQWDFFKLLFRKATALVRSITETKHSEEKRVDELLTELIYTQELMNKYSTASTLSFIKQIEKEILKIKVEFHKVPDAGGPSLG